MINNSNDTISAIATVIGTGGVSIIRLSGENSKNIVEKICFDKKHSKAITLIPNTISHGFIFDNETLVDEVVVLYFKAPHSYTGEDICEIQCHGGIQVTKNILDITLHNGARLAERGEFTKRAFMNGKLDLSQAEAVLDIISAKTKKFAQISATNLCGKLAEKITEIRSDIVSLLSNIVAAIDFPEEVEEPDYDLIASQVNSIISNIDSVLLGSKNSNIFRQGVKIAIVGKPNVGKSSLFNSLLNFDRAIVTDIAGTTRDILSESIDLNGIPVTLIDTAGIRELENSDELNKVENIGIEYSKKSIEEADIVIFVTDISSESTDEDAQIFSIIKNKKYITVGTKSDLLQKNTSFDIAIKISNINKNGISQLMDLLSNLISNETGEEMEFLTNARQQESLKNAKIALNNSLVSIQNNVEQDFIAIDIKSALMYLGEITGDDINQEIINNIFDKFCIGK